MNEDIIKEIRMAPFLLMDKSAIQGLSFECFEHLDRYYSHVISPILLREVTSDLAKEDKKKSDDELKNTVRHLSAKTNSPRSHFLADAFKMAYNNFFGTQVPMDGRIPLEQGIFVKMEGLGSGVFFDELEETRLLRRWEDGSFDEEDLQKAKEIRDIDSGIDLETLYKDAIQDLADLPKFESLEKLVVWVDQVHFAPADPGQLVFNAAYHILGQNSDHLKLAILRWKQHGCPDLKQFAPYARYFYRVDMIHVLGIARGLIKRGKSAKAHLDVQYLYYLPFCHIFTSGDNELIKQVKFFLRPDQEFISKTDFQNDLKAIAQYFSILSEEDKKAY